MKVESKKLRLMGYFMAIYCVFTVMQNLFEMKILFIFAASLVSPKG